MVRKGVKRNFRDKLTEYIHGLYGLQRDLLGYSKAREIVKEPSLERDEIIHAKNLELQKIREDINELEKRIKKYINKQLMT